MTSCTLKTIPNMYCMWTITPKGTADVILFSIIQIFISGGDGYLDIISMNVFMKN